MFWFPTADPPVFIPQPLLSCSCTAACVLCCAALLQSSWLGLLVLFDKNLQGCLWWRYPGSALLSALGNALFLVSSGGLSCTARPGCLPQASRSPWHPPVLCQLCPQAAALLGTRGLPGFGLGAQSGLLKGQTPGSFMQRNGAVAMHVKPDQSAGVWAVPSGHCTGELSLRGAGAEPGHCPVPCWVSWGPAALAWSQLHPRLPQGWGRAAAAQCLLLLKPIDWTF